VEPPDVAPGSLTLAARTPARQVPISSGLDTFSVPQCDWLRFMQQFQYAAVNKPNSAAMVQMGQRHHTIEDRNQAT